jgi:putative methyltransferase (TIGR04325 family)
MNILQRAPWRLPGSRLLRDLIQRFNIRYCRGIYRTFQEAQAAIDPLRRVGYDNPQSSTLYHGRLDLVKPSDYAIFYWLGPLLAGARSVFDFGGNVGWSYYAFQKYLAYPPRLRWVICDVPAVVDAGRALASQREAPHLRFTTQFREADRSDVLFTSGTLQYVEQDLAALLGALDNKPPHVLINRVPFSDRPTYFTVQDIGTACCPYKVSNQAEFVTSLQRLGYALVDTWRCPESACRVLFRPMRSVRHYTGMYFRKGDGLRSDQAAEACLAADQRSRRPA